MDNEQTLDGEEWWASEAVDDTDSLIGSLLKLSKFCMERNVNVADAKLLFAELSLHNDKHNIELDTDKWLIFCARQRESDVADMANEVEVKLKTYVKKYLTSGPR